MPRLSKSCRVQLVAKRLVRDVSAREMRQLSFVATPCEPFGETQPTAQLELVVTPEYAKEFVDGDVFFVSFRRDDTPES